MGRLLTAQTHRRNLPSINITDISRISMWIYGFVISAYFAGICGADCPFLAAQKGTRALHMQEVSQTHRQLNLQQDEDVLQYYEALGNIDFDEVKTDIVDLIHSSEEWWPADWQSVGGSYGPFFIRLAWHCSGSYRTSDGRGGCDGGRQRFNPEQSWEDNANLDKARELLWPVKQKYGEGLSWGDLFVLAGTTAIEDMGGPIIGFCAGRIDDSSGAASAPLGPTQYQEDLYPCELNGNCSAPLGSEKVGLIYVDPTGHLGNPDPALSVADIRDVFGRMAMNDTEVGCDFVYRILV